MVRIKEIREYASATAPVSRHPVRISRRRSIRYGYLLYVGRYGKSLFGQYVHISYQQHEFQCAVRQNGSPIVYPPVKETLPDGSYTLYRYSSFAQYSDSLPEIYTPYAAGMMHEPPSYSSRTYLPRPLMHGNGGCCWNKACIRPTGPCRSPTTTGAKRRAPRFSEPVVCPRVTG